MLESDQVVCQSHEAHDHRPDAEQHDRQHDHGLPAGAPHRDLGVVAPGLDDLVLVDPATPDLVVEPLRPGPVVHRLDGLAVRVEPRVLSRQFHAEQRGHGAGGQDDQAGEARHRGRSHVRGGCDGQNGQRQSERYRSHDGAVAVAPSDRLGRFGVVGGGHDGLTFIVSAVSAEY